VYRKTSRLAWHFVKYFRNLLFLQTTWGILYGANAFAPTLLLKAILEYVENPKRDQENQAPWLFVILLFVSGIVSAVAGGQPLWIGRKIGIRLRSVLVGEIYAKALRRNAAADTDAVLNQVKTRDQGNKKKESNMQANVGKIINLMAVDSLNISEGGAYLFSLLAEVPLPTAIAIVLLWDVLGWSSVAGIGIMLLLIPINILIAEQYTKTQKTILSATDARIHTTNEVLQNIRIIKFFSWEDRFGKIVDEKREIELRRLRNRYIVLALSVAVGHATPLLITAFSFYIYTMVEKKDLIPSVAFSALSLFAILQRPLNELTRLIPYLQNTKVSVDRVEKFLDEPETGKYKQLGCAAAAPESDEVKLGFKDATFTWGGILPIESNPSINRDPFKLIDLSVDFQVGRLNVIAGPTGCGKTAMLMALLGEMNLLNGEVYLPGGGQSRDDIHPDLTTGLVESVAYCAQQAWLVNDTVQQNITFASAWDSERYKKVLLACALEQDLAILDAGDATLVGEKGIALSGGQKQRISLARAVYSKSRHLLLDDCLSAVDSHTAQWILRNCIMGPLMEHRTCILATHNVALCAPHATYLVLLGDGRISIQGDARSVIASGALGDLGEGGLLRAPALAEPTTPEQSGARSEATPAHAGLTANGTDTETKATGRIKWSVVHTYLAAMGSTKFWISAVAIFTAQQLGSVATNVWIREWADSYQLKYTNAASAGVDVSYYLGVYAAIGGAYLLLSLAKDAALFGGSLAASRKIHRRLLESITGARFQFFDSTPLGQMINRFSKDIDTLDRQVAPVAVRALECIAALATTVGMISVVTPAFLIVGVFISAIYFYIGKFYIRSSRSLKRLEAVNRSPIYQHFGETLTGVVTIRAYGDERRFVRENLAKINAHHRPFLYLWAANRWLAFRLDCMGALVAFFAGAFVLLSTGRIDAGSAGLSLMYAITFTVNVVYLVRLHVDNEQNLNSSVFS
jgi:ABC-type multidrug transport system fused ATPase/permease subunit